jgi:hypothetical protein
MDIFWDFLKHFLEVFIDDFVVYSERSRHLGFLRQTFQRCRETGLKLHPGKCFMGVMRGVLLGHIVSNRELEVDINKVKAILTLTPPKAVKEVRGFLGCVGYYRRFVDGYAKVAHPLTKLTKKDEEFTWTETRQEAFDKLKECLVNAPILSPPIWTLDFHLTIDASGFCLGTIPWQEHEPKLENVVYYASKQLSLAERKYSATEREALGVVYACKKYRHYLLGYKKIFHTDHDALKHLVNKPDLSGIIARWIILLQAMSSQGQRATSSQKWKKTKCGSRSGTCALMTLCLPSSGNGLLLQPSSGNGLLSQSSCNVQPMSPSSPSSLACRPS